MSEFSSQELFEFLARQWEKATLERRFDDAVQQSVSAFLLFRSLRDPSLAMAALAWLSRSITDLFADTKSQELKLSTSSLSCSFCGKAPPQVQVVAGASAAICDACVALIGQQFQPRN